MPDGSCGVQCANQPVDGCWESTECKKAPTFTALMLAQYTEEEIRQMSGQPVTERRFLDALRHDGLPVK
jgi:hypothetical protein